MSKFAQTSSIFCPLTKVPWPARLHNPPVSPAREQLHLAAGLTVRENAKGIGRLVREATEHLVQSLGLHLVQEPLDIGAWQAVQGVKAQAHVFDEDWRVG